MTNIVVSRFLMLWKNSLDNGFLCTGGAKFD
jgi:hypothetical protein